MERHDWFHYILSTEYMVKHFGTHELKINAALFERVYPSIAEKYGADQELEV